MFENPSNAVNPAEALRKLSEEIKIELVGIETLKAEISKTIIGQHKMLDSLLIALLSNGHILLEGVPGLAKTLAIKTLSDAIDGSFNRIQFTPDLLPADLTGTMVYHQKSESFAVKKDGGVRAKSVHKTRDEAEIAMPSKGHSIEHRLGARTRCESFCQVSGFCKQHQLYLSTKEEK